jgi:hypothetical protein
MSMQLPCPRCGTTRDVDIVEREEKVTIRGREVPFTAGFSRCMTCGEEFEAPGQLDANLAAAREAYARLYEITEARRTGRAPYPLRRPVRRLSALFSVSASSTMEQL